jgi:hypothetical protein
MRSRKRPTIAQGIGDLRIAAVETPDQRLRRV